MSTNDDEQIIITREELEALREVWGNLAHSAADPQPWLKALRSIFDRNPPSDPDDKIIEAIALALMEDDDDTLEWMDDLLECERAGYIAEAKVALAAARKAGADL